VGKVVGIAFAVLLVIVVFVAIKNKQGVSEASPTSIKFYPPSKPSEPNVPTAEAGKAKKTDLKDFCEIPLSFKVYEGATGPPLMCKDMKAGKLTATLTGRVIVEDSGETRAFPWQSGYTVQLDVADKICNPPTPYCSYDYRGTKESSWPTISTLTVQREISGGNIRAFVRFPSCVTSAGYKTNCRFEDGSKLTMQVE
jgi:hypothetical protein